MRRRARSPKTASRFARWTPRKATSSRPQRAPAPPIPPSAGRTTRESRDRSVRRLDAQPRHSPPQGRLWAEPLARLTIGRTRRLPTFCDNWSYAEHTRLMTEECPFCGSAEGAALWQGLGGVPQYVPGWAGGKNPRSLWSAGSRRRGRSSVCHPSRRGEPGGVSACRRRHSRIRVLKSRVPHAPTKQYRQPLSRPSSYDDICS